MIEEKIDLDAPYFGSMTPNQLLAILKLATAHDFDWSTYDAKQLGLSIMQSIPRKYPFYEPHSDQYVMISITLQKEGGGYHESYRAFEFKVFDDGFVSYENGSGVKMRYSNPIEVNAMVAKALGK